MLVCSSFHDFNQLYIIISSLVRDDTEQGSIGTNVCFSRVASDSH